MATLRDLRSRIKGVQSTQQITKAMKMVAAAKLRKAQEAIINARPYADRLSKLVARLVSDDDKLRNQYIVERPVKKVALVIVTADRGLCGSFNTNLIKEATNYISEELESKNIDYTLYMIGKKGYEHFKKRGYPVLDQKINLFSHLNVQIALQIAHQLIDGYQKEEYDRVVIIFNEFKSVIQQKIVVSQYLPIPVESFDSEEHTDTLYIYEPSQQKIFESLLPQHLETQLWRVLLESNAAELGAKMTAMDNASTNAQELIRSLKMKYNKERQAAITKEILEVVSGANALKG